MREKEDRGTLHGAHIVGEQELSFVSDTQAKRRARKRQNIIFSTMAVIVLLAFISATLVFTGILKIGGTAQAGQEARMNPAQIKDKACPGIDFTYQDPGSFSVRVLNATDVAGLAGDTAKALEKRGFDVAGTSSGMNDYADSVAAVFAGPKGYAQALTIQRQVPGSVFVFDPKVYGTQVDLALGAQFESLVKERKLDTKPGPLVCAQDSKQG